MSPFRTRRLIVAGFVVTAAALVLLEYRFG
jgi:hypothetical protein